MRVGFFIGEIQNAKSGGAYTFQLSVINGLSNIISEHEFYCYYRSEKKELLKDTNNIKFININFESIDYSKIEKYFDDSINLQVNLNTLIIRDKIEFVYFIIISYEKINAPFAFTVWDLGHRSIPYFPEVSYCDWTQTKREEFYSEILPKASYIVVGNNIGKNEICKYYDIDEKRVITIAMPTPEYVRSVIEDDSIIKKYNLEYHKYLFYPAQFWPHKNHIRLLKAIKKLKDIGFDFKLVLTGSDKGNEEYIKLKVKEYGIDKNVLFLGFVSQNEVIALYKNAFALTFASMLGPDNIPPLEAMALKCPVICSDIQGMQEQLKDSALFFNPLSEDSLVEQILNLYNDEAMRKSLIENGMILAEKCSIKNYIDKMMKIINDFSFIRECWSGNKFYTGEGKVTSNLNIKETVYSIENKLNNKIENLKLHKNWIELFGIYNNKEYIKVVLFGFKMIFKMTPERIKKIAWWIPVNKFKDNFRKKFE